MDVAKTRAALRAELERRGYPVSSDTVSLHGEFYIAGPNDGALAMFEFKDRAGDAVGSMYQGFWAEGMPPRVAVMPATESASPLLGLLAQMKIVALLAIESGDAVTFPGLDAFLVEHVSPQS
jgi:hypothetical protein